jgi:hypothetical protein
MAKLYAELTSDKGGRVASKGGDNQVIATFKKGNNVTFTVAQTLTHLVISDSAGVITKLKQLK